MNRLSLTLVVAVLFMSITLTSCEAIGGIFKAGVWVGVLGIALVVFLILYFIGRSKK